MFCCVRRTRGRKEGNFDERHAKSRGAWPPPGNYVHSIEGGKSKGTADRGLKDGNMVVLAGAGAGAAVGAAAVVVAATSNDQTTDRNSDGSASQGCCGRRGGGGGCGGGGCGGCGGCGGSQLAEGSPADVSVGRPHYHLPSPDSVTAAG
ncbi:hypothetical protein STAS_22015 [Striga asiatica]|uniref:Uncharacterized protein n=1 Tax=Striga asiatica TaxID=4170 RepID=A0A5A7QIZ6_STRAF|nr:hypothetical protein STAS_22015 [Striga asiatica]